MASFLDGLFPNREVAPDPELEPMVGVSNSLESERFTRPLSTNDDDPPTEVMKRLATDELELPEAEAPVEHTIRHRPPPSFLDEFQDISRSSALGPLAVAGDESTLVRERPKVDDPSTWSNEETIIKSRKPRKASPPSNPAPSPPSPSAPTIRKTRPDKPASSAIGTQPQKRLQLVYTVVGAVVTGMVLWVGILLGIRLSERTAQSSQPEGSIEMTIPDRSSVEVNDEDHDPAQPYQLRSGTQDMVRIAVPDYNSDPITLEVELDSFELKIRLESTVGDDDPVDSAPD